MIALLLALLLCTPAQTDTRVSVTVSPRSGEVGLLMKLTVLVSGPAAADCEMLAIPVVTGATLLRLEGPNTSQRTFIVNNDISRTVETEWVYKLVPEQAGTLRVPPFSLQCRGETLISQPVMVPVSEGALLDKVVDLKVRVPQGTTLWQGQTFDIEVLAYLDEAYSDRIIAQGLDLTLAWYDGLDDLVRLEAPATTNMVAHIYLNHSRRPIATQVGRETIDDRVWRVYRLSVPMLATRAGTIELPPSHFSATVATAVERQRDPFDAFLRGSRNVVTRAVEDTATAPGIVLEVRAPPQDDRPSFYTNAMGAFHLVGAAAPRKLKVGETCTISMKLTGQGNLEFVEWPPFDELAADFRIFGKQERRDDNSRTFAIEISPKHVRVDEIPMLHMASFNPLVGDYEVLTVGPFPIEVTGGGDEGLVELAGPAEILNDLETIREQLPVAQHESVPAWGWLVPGALLLMGVELRQRRHRWRSDNPDQVARRGARRALDTSLAAAGDTRDVAVAFGKYLAARLGGPPAGLTADEAAEELLGRGAPDELCQRLRDVVGGWEASYLGGRPLEMDTARTEAHQLAKDVESAS